MLIKSILCAAAMSALAFQGHAATLDQVSVDTSVAYFDDDQGNGNQTNGFIESLFGDDIFAGADAFGGDVPGATAGLGPVEAITIDLVFNGDDVDLFSQLTVDGATDTLLTAVAIDAAFASDMISVLFSVDGGVDAATFGPFAVLTFTNFGFDAGSGTGSVFDASAFGPVPTDFTLASARDVAPIPVPASGFVLVAAIAGLGAVRSRRQS